MTFYENENTAKIISKNKIKLVIKDKDLISNSENKFLDESLKFENKTILKKVGMTFFLKIRYIDERLFVQNIPDTKLSKRFYKILLEARSLSIGFSKFVGCKINVEKILMKLKIKFIKILKIMRSFSLNFPS